MESTVTRSRITILANLLVNDAIKEKRFLRLIETLCKDEFFDFSIRLRGNRAEELEEKISILLKEKKSLFKIRIGENVKNWKLNSFIQTFDFKNEYFLLLNEDHFPNTELEILREYLQQCVQANIEVSGISFYPSYKKLVNYLANSFDQDRKILIQGYLTSKEWKRVPKEAKNYPISLLGMYKKDFLRKLLKSRKPFWRRYPFNSPFDFEQSGTSAWIFPFSFALPTVEIFACIDDDCGIDAYSLISRGVYREDTIMRVPVHHKYGRIEQKYMLNEDNSNAFNITQKHSLTFVILRRLFNLLRLIRYSIHGCLTWDYQKAKVRYIINRGK
jgi:hypothetical protein